MIFALRHPAVLLGLLLGFLVGVILRVEVQRRIARSPTPGRRGALRGVGSRVTTLRPRTGWAAYFDPYGAVAAALAGVGWGSRPAPGRGRRTDIAQLAGALAVHGALAAVGFAGFDAAGGPLSVLGGVNVSDVLHGSIHAPSTGQSVALGFGMVNLACGLLALTPIPPLELGVVLWSRLPRSPGARRFAYHLLEEQWGVAVILVLLLLPLGGGPPALLAIIDSIGSAILRPL